MLPCLVAGFLCAHFECGDSGAHVCGARCSIEALFFLLVWCMLVRVEVDRGLWRTIRGTVIVAFVFGSDFVAFWSVVRVAVCFGAARLLLVVTLALFRECVRLEMRFCLRGLAEVARFPWRFRFGNFAEEKRRELLVVLLRGVELRRWSVEGVYKTLALCTQFQCLFAWSGGSNAVDDRLLRLLRHRHRHLRPNAYLSA
jgi:hypothetical protein